jgi:signal transduction histidine kinase
MRRRLTPARFDALLALLAFAVMAVELTALGDPSLPLAVQIAGSGVMGFALGLRRRSPLLATALLFAAAIPLASQIEDVTSPFLTILVMAFTLGTLEVRRAVIGLAGAQVGMLGLATAFSTGVVGDYLFPAGFAAAAWGMGRTIAHRTQLTAELHEAAIVAREEQERERDRAVADERRRIAREMHDVVAHSVSVMVVQAGGARRILDRDPARAVEAAERIEHAGRTALVEMRRLLGVLHPGEPDATVLPQPTLDAVDALVGRARDAGMPVEVEVAGERRPLPAGAEVAVYRIVQEALTNALKHAGGAATDVRLAWNDDALEVTIADRGRATPAAEAPLPSGSHGIVGMRERVRVYGGTLEAGPQPGGGFRVRARIPLRQEALAA